MEKNGQHNFGNHIETGNETVEQKGTLHFHDPTHRSINTNEKHGLSSKKTLIRLDSRARHTQYRIKIEDTGHTKDSQTPPSTGAAGDAPATRASDDRTVASLDSGPDTQEATDTPLAEGVLMERRLSSHSQRSCTLSPDPDPSGGVSQHTTPPGNGRSTVPQSPLETTRPHPSHGQLRLHPPPSPVDWSPQRPLQEGRRSRVPGGEPMQMHTSYNPAEPNPRPPQPQGMQNSLPMGQTSQPPVQSMADFAPASTHNPYTGGGILTPRRRRNMGRVPPSQEDTSSYAPSWSFEPHLPPHNQNLQSGMPGSNAVATQTFDHTNVQLPDTSTPPVSAPSNLNHPNSPFENYEQLYRRLPPHPSYGPPAHQAEYTPSIPASAPLPAFRYSWDPECEDEN